MANRLERFFNNRRVQRYILLPMVLIGIVLLALGLSGAFADGGTDVIIYSPTPVWHDTRMNTVCFDILGYQDFYETHQLKSDVFTVLVLIDDGTGNVTLPVLYDEGKTRCYRGTNLGAHREEIMFQAQLACQERGRCKTEVATTDRFNTTSGAGSPNSLR